MIYRRLLFIFVISCEQSVNSRVVIYLLTVIHCLRSLNCKFKFYLNCKPLLVIKCKRPLTLQPRFFVPEIFIPESYGTENRHQKMEPICGAVSGACVMGIINF